MKDKTLGNRIDYLWAMEKDLEDMENELRNVKLYQDIQTLKESIEDYKTKLLAEYDDNHLSGAGGLHGRATIRKTETWTPYDWEAFIIYVAERDAWDLLHRRVTTKAVRARLEDGEEVPGIQKSVKRTLSVRGF